MKIMIKAEFSTDGDYWIDLEHGNISKQTNDEIVVNLPQKKFIIYTKQSISHLFDDDYTITKVFECQNSDLDKSYCMMYARSYLEELFCDIRYVSTHYYIVKYFYDMFEAAIKSIGKEKTHYGCVSGNYEGTELYIKCIE